MSVFPDCYPSALHLPFNAAALGGNFRLQTPGTAPDAPEGIWLLLQGTRLVLRTGVFPPLPDGAQPSFAAGTGRPPLFFGRWQEQPCFALALPRQLELPAGYVFEDILTSDPSIGIDLLSLAAVAGQALHWERNSRVCSRCGEQMSRLTGEWGKKCTGCGYDHYPHIHPCIIVLVRRGDEVLLVRKGNWPQGRYGLVAGFLDFGECLEEAVVREVREETGVEVENVRYVGSQAWPFPSQLMAGFVADWRSGEVVVEEKELEDARWFRLDALPNLPPRRSISRYLIDTYAK